MPDAVVAALTRQRLDLADFPTVRAEFRRQQPNLVIHCAALSRSPECEANPALARKLNVEVTTLLAELAAEIPFIFLSSDLVFDGRSCFFDSSGTLIARGRGFEEDLVIADLATPSPASAGSIAKDDFTPEAEIWQALVLGTRLVSG